MNTRAAASAGLILVLLGLGMLGSEMALDDTELAQFDAEFDRSILSSVFTDGSLSGSVTRGARGAPRDGRPEGGLDVFIDPEQCVNGRLDPGESDIDCGGPCRACGLGQQCRNNRDCANGNCINGICQAIELVSVELTCTDSDGGDNPDTPGIVTVVASTGEQLTLADFCGVDDPFVGSLIEAVCVDDDAQVRVHTCDNGCANGMCLAEISPEIETPGRIPCVDTDGGRNEFVFGETVMPDGSGLDDTCQGDTLLEAVCFGPEITSHLIIPCEFGCENGACRLSSLPVVPADTCRINPDGTDNCPADTCSDNILVQFSCEQGPQGNFACDESGVLCPETEQCVGNTCVPSTTCVDSETGQDPQIAGRAMDIAPDGTVVNTESDSCVVGSAGRFVFQCRSGGNENCGISESFCDSNGKAFIDLTQTTTLCSFCTGGRCTPTRACVSNFGQRCPPPICGGTINCDGRCNLGQVCVGSSQCINNRCTIVGCVANQGQLCAPPGCGTVPCDGRCTVCSANQACINNQCQTPTLQPLPGAIIQPITGPITAPITTPTTATCAAIGASCDAPGRRCASGICAAPLQFVGGINQALQGTYICITPAQFQQRCIPLGNTPPSWNCIINPCP